jgi:hypothetical protein
MASTNVLVPGVMPESEAEAAQEWNQRATPAIPPIIDVVRLAVKPGEVLAVRMPVDTSPSERERTERFFSYYLPDVAVLLASDQVSFAVIEKPTP